MVFFSDNVVPTDQGPFEIAHTIGPRSPDILSVGTALLLEDLERIPALAIDSIWNTAFDRRTPLGYRYS